MRWLLKCKIFVTLWLWFDFFWNKYWKNLFYWVPKFSPFIIFSWLVVLDLQRVTMDNFSVLMQFFGKSWMLMLHVRKTRRTNPASFKEILKWAMHSYVSKSCQEPKNFRNYYHYLFGSSILIVHMDISWYTC